MSEVEVVVAAGAELGEGPVWDARSGRVVWVDIVGKSIHQTDPLTGLTESVSVPLHIGAVAARAAGGFIAALQDGFWVIGDGAARRVVASPDDASVRFNDGKCDPSGRFWAGTMGYQQTPGAAALYCLDTDGSLTRMLDNVTISNGMAWSDDGSTLFYIDTATHCIDAFDFATTGKISNRRTVVATPLAAGSPDGMTIDSEGGLWVAFWGGSAVHRYLDGRLNHVIQVPVSQPTSCAFGGPDLADLYITSAWTGLTKSERFEQPLAGALFRIRPGVRGVAPFEYGGA